MTLTEFLLARIAEDEAAVAELVADYKRTADIHGGNPELKVTFDPPAPNSNMHGEMWYPDYGLTPDDYWGYFDTDPARVMAECAAKRGIIEEPFADDWTGSQDKWTNVLEWLALPYSWHKDYSEDWRPLR